MSNFMLYASYGYTGALIADVAVKQGMRPLLAGRDPSRLQAQAERLGLEYRAFSLDDTAALDSALREVEAVLHCAGPFVHTFRQMAQACLRTGRHYVDISGEISGFETLASLDADAKKVSIMLLPGGGFDVVPTDCLASHLKRRLPGATKLRLFLRGVGAGFSRGTAASAIENMHRQGMIRRDGKLEQVPPAWKVLEQDFGRGPVKVVSVGWGDVSTAYYSTGIPNIETYFAFPPFAIQFLRASRVFGPILYTRLVKALLKAMLGFTPAGPSEEKRVSGFSLMIGEALDDRGGRLISKLQTPEGYHLTSLTAVEIMRRILVSDFKPGFQTPSLLYGSDFILQFPNTKREDLV